MVLIQKGRAWRLFFAVTIVSVFIGYCFFWRHTFVDSSAAGSSVISENCGTCRDLPPDLFSPDDASAIREDPGSRGVHASVGRHHRSKASTRARHGSRHKLLGAPLRGPYSLAVRQSLRGVLLPEVGPNRLGIRKSMSHFETASLGDAYPSTAPTYGYMTSGFGVRRSPFHGGLVQHRGVDFAVPYGADVFATGDGEVVFAGWFSGLGRTVTIDHGGGLITRYAHASSLEVNEGDFVRRGDVIAKAGNSGRSTGTHLHYEVWMSGRAVDPVAFLSGDPQESLLAKQDQDESEISSAADPEAGLGLAMGGDGATFSEPGAVSMARYEGRALYKKNLFILVGFAIIAVGLLVSVMRHEPKLVQ